MNQTQRASSAKNAKGAAPTMEQLQTSLKRSRTWNVVLAAIVVFLGVVVLAQTLQGKTEEEAVAAEEVVAVETDTSENGETVAAEENEGGEREFVRRQEGDPMAVGDVNAPVVMTEWVDLQCPYCALFANDTLPTLIEQYVDTGQLLIEFSDVAYFGEGSVEGAVAARAAAEQGMYFDFIKAVYAMGENAPELDREVLMGVAEDIGIPDMAKFEADYDSEEIRAAVAQSNADAQAIGVSSVPFFVIENTPMTGAQPLEAFQSFIEDFAAKK